MDNDNRVLEAARMMSGYDPNIKGRSQFDEVRRAGAILARRYFAEHPATDSEPVTTEWLLTLPGRVVHPASMDTVLIQISGNEFLAVEVDLSLAIQQGHYDQQDAQYIDLPFKATSRGIVRRLLAALQPAPGVPPCPA